MGRVMKFASGFSALFIFGPVGGFRIKSSDEDLVLSPGEECWDACGEKSGACDKCGAGTACCQKNKQGNCWWNCDDDLCKLGYDWKQESIHECVPLRSTVQVFKNDEIEHMLPMAPEDYPEPLKGIIWMDQEGFYGESDVESGSPSGCVAFGDMDNPLNKATEKQTVDVTGPAWQWFNNEEGYRSFASAGGMGYKYTFEWKDNYTHAQIYPIVGSIGVPSGLMSFTMELQTPLPGACPPPKGADRKDIGKCAKWKRISTAVGGFTGPAVYYAYEIVDKNGQRNQPYYDKYLEWTNKHSKPNASMATAAGIICDNILTQNSSFHGLSGR